MMYDAVKDTHLGHSSKAPARKELACLPHILAKFEPHLQRPVLRQVQIRESSSMADQISWKAEDFPCTL